jgi:hypothetical protein
MKNNRRMSLNAAMAIQDKNIFNKIRKGIIRTGNKRPKEEEIFNDLKMVMRGKKI